MMACLKFYPFKKTSNDYKKGTQQCKEDFPSFIFHSNGEPNIYCMQTLLNNEGNTVIQEKLNYNIMDRKKTCSKKDNDVCDV